MDNVKIFTPDPTDPAPIVVDPTFEPVENSQIDERAVYDGDISDGILAKLSSYYRDHGSGDYVIYRIDQYHYQLVYGDFDGTVFTDATIVSYSIGGSYQQTASVSVSNSSSFRPDLTGSTGYIYSSYDAFVPSRYIDLHEMSSYKYSHVMTICMVLAMLIYIVTNFLHSLRGRK